ncbi:MAG TPA: asparagine synthase (glutamine-hydrolyzing) [Phycisphaerales bacterium]|nr:asparagine synthase (glutamine-hydrolyzing) [Phycisphaerales bacterium]
MCGIAGILRVHQPGDAPPPPDSIPDAWLDLLDDAIAHRGPDGQGRFRDRSVRKDGRKVDVALVHRRLAIIDPATGAQPLVTGNGNDLRATIFNGCIYNHRSLRKELESHGQVFRTDHSDTEVIPLAHAVWGDHAPARFDGMFAYAVWSRAEAELITARDIAGEKPLYEATLHHSTLGDVYVFASTMTAIGRWLSRFGARFNWQGHRCAPDGLLNWLRFGGSHVSLLQDINPTGESAESGELDVRVVSRFTNADNTDGDTRSYPSRSWYGDLPLRQRDSGVITPESVDAMIGRAVRSRLEADVPLGCFLSGGVDSSLVAWHARQAAGSLKTFTVRMPDARYDESGFAEQASKAIGSTHTTLECDARPAEQLPALIAQLGLPFADSSLLPTSWVSTAARQHVKVALTGDAGDELFMGYERHQAALVLHRWSGVLRHLPASLGEGSHPKSRLSKLGRLGIAARGGYAELLSIFPRPMLLDLAPGLAGHTRHLPTYQVEDGPRWDFQWYLPGDLLRKTDTAAMSIALETRAPFLAREVIDFGLTTPLRELGRGGRKGLLRAAARLHLPAGIVDRPKMGFAIPIGEWFRSDFGGLRQLLRDTITPADAFPADLLGTDLDRGFIECLMREHDQGTRDHGQRLYLLLVLGLWCRVVRGWSR